MPAYLVINNGDVNKSYKCNTTHTSKPYIQVNETNYLDLTSETTTGLQLKYKQKTGSSYSMYNTTSSLEKTTSTTMTKVYYSGQWYSMASISMSSNINYPVLPPPTIMGQTTSSTSLQRTITSSTTSRETTSSITHTMTLTYETGYDITEISSTVINTIKSYSSSEVCTSQSKVTFRNRIYIPVQSKSTTVTSTTSSQYIATTAYSGRSTYNTTTTQTTGYSGASWWSEDNRKTTGYSAYSTSARTTGSGYRSTSTNTRRTSTTGYSGRSTYKQTTGYSGVVRRTSTTRTYYSGWRKTVDSATVNLTTLQNAYGSSSTSILKSSSGQTTTTATSSKTLVSTSRKTTFVGIHSYMTYWTTSIVSARYRTNTYTVRVTSNAVGALSSTTALTRNTYSLRTSNAIGALVSATALTKTYNTTTATRYATTDDNPWYADFTASVTGTSRVYNYWTSTAKPSNAVGTTALISGTTTRKSSYATSTAAGALSSTTALISTGVRTSSSYHVSSIPGMLLSTTALTETKSRTSLTSGTSSTDL